jgi:hypothetical protein
MSRHSVGTLALASFLAAIGCSNNSVPPPDPARQVKEITIPKNKRDVHATRGGPDIGGPGQPPPK